MLWTWHTIKVKSVRCWDCFRIADDLFVVWEDLLGSKIKSKKGFRRCLQQWGWSWIPLGIGILYSSKEFMFTPPRRSKSARSFSPQIVNSKTKNGVHDIWNQMHKICYNYMRSVLNFETIGFSVGVIGSGMRMYEKKRLFPKGGVQWGWPPRLINREGPTQSCIASWSVMWVLINLVCMLPSTLPLAMAIYSWFAH